MKSQIKVWKWGFNAVGINIFFRVQDKYDHKVWWKDIYDRDLMLCCKYSFSLKYKDKYDHKVGCKE